MDKEYFICILNSNKNLIYKICKIYCSNATEHLNLEKEILIHLWNSFSKINSGVKISTLMYRVSLNSAISYYRNDYRHTNKKVQMDSTVISEFPEIQSDKEEKTEVLYESILQLNEFDKALILLYLDDHSDKDIAEIMGITETNVGIKLRRIKQKLRTQYKNHNLYIMKLEEMKRIWNIQEKKLDQVLRFNRELFIKLKIEKSKYNVRKPLITEIISLLVITGIIILIAAFSVHMYSKPQYSIAGFIAVNLSTVYLFFSVRRYKMLSKIDLVKTDIMTLQKELAILKSVILRARKTELALLPVFIITLMPVVFIKLAGINLYNNLILFGTEVAAILGLGYMVRKRITPKVYNEKLKETGSFLKEIRDYVFE